MKNKKGYGIKKLKLSRSNKSKSLVEFLADVSIFAGVYSI